MVTENDRMSEAETERKAIFSLVPYIVVVICCNTCEHCINCEHLSSLCLLGMRLGYVWLYLGVVTTYAIIAHFSCYIHITRALHTHARKFENH